MLRALAPLLLMSACVGPAEPTSAVDAPAPLLGAAVGRVAPEHVRPAPPRLERPACIPSAAVTFVPAGARRLAEVTSVTATVALPRPCTAERITVELIGPRGNPFEVRTAQSPGAASATFSFPVAGAAIEHRGLSGPWQLRAFADGSAVSPQSFELDR